MKYTTPLCLLRGYERILLHFHLQIRQATSLIYLHWFAAVLFWAFESCNLCGGVLADLSVKLSYHQTFEHLCGKANARSVWPDILAHPVLLVLFQEPVGRAQLGAPACRVRVNQYAIS